MFLGTAGDAYEYAMRTQEEPENLDYFSAWVNEWAYQNSDELSEMVFTIEETETILIDETE